MRLDVFDPASRPEQFRFVHEPHWSIPISLVRERIRELLRQTVRVDDGRFDAEVDQMIERESDERFLENRHKRLGQIVSQRPKPGAKPRAQNECSHDRGHQRLVLC